MLSGRYCRIPGQRDWLAAHAREDASQYGWVTRAERVLDGLGLA